MRNVIDGDRSFLIPHSSSLGVAHLVRAVFPQHGYGGMERSATALTRQLLRNGLDVTLFTRPWPPGAISPAEEPGGGHLRVVPIPYSALPLRPNSIAARLTNYPLFVERMGRATARLVGQGGATVVHAHGLCAWGVRQQARRRGPGGRIVPLIMNPHGLEDFKVRDPLKRLAYAPFRTMYRAGAQAADRVIATDWGARDEVCRLLGVSPERVVVLPNALDLDEVLGPVSAERQAALRARWGLAPDGVIGLSVGRLEANKGFSHLLRALAALPADLPPWRWLIVGVGKDREALGRLAGELGLGDQVIFTGAVGDADLQNLYALATLFVHPSLYEGSSLVTLEALAHARPVVASGVGYIPDKVRPGETGLLVPPGDAPALGTAIAWCLRHPAEAAALGQAGAALVRRDYTWPAVARQTIAVYEEVVSSQPSAVSKTRKPNH
jgi:glycosyltransferase involved in cell wall biosynthesis